jgi:hypothetical protein
MKEPDDLTLRTYSPEYPKRRPTPGSAGQSGDDMGLSEDEVSGSESVTELLQEGQYFEAEAVSGTERPEVDTKEVRTHEQLADDVPLEYPPRDPALDVDYDIDDVD